MKETISKSYTNVDEQWQHANWYRAMTLSERAALLRENPNGPIVATPGSIEKAKQRLQHWKEHVPFNGGTCFAQRLAMDALTEDDLLTLLAEPIEAVQARMSTPPIWLTKLASAFEEWHSTVPIIVSLPENEQNAASIAFLNTLKPLVKSGLVHLQAAIQQLTQKYSRLPFDPQTILPLLFAHLPGHILPKLLRTIILELNVARVQGRLQGTTPQERFQYFLQQLNHDEIMLPLLEEYAVLTRLLVEAIERWVTCELELLERLCADWEEIRSMFTPENDPGVLVDIQAGQGDSHRGGRTVTVLGWSSGFHLVYKPRPMAIDVHFQQLLSWLNTQGYQPAFRIFKVINKGIYGWAEFVQANPCSSKEEVERFYQRQGGYLALLYALEAMDFHSENLIAAGEYPMLVDLESLFHPRVAEQAAMEQEYLGMETISHSVLRIGLLPQRIYANEQAAGVDISGFGDQAGQLTPGPVAKWTDTGTDQMRVIRERIVRTPQQHRPKLHDQDVNTLEYCNSIIAGFTTAYRLLLGHRDELFTEVLPWFARDEIRCLVRPTRIYSMLITDSFHPDMLRDALDRDHLFDRLWLGIDEQSSLLRLIPAEQTDLLAGDVPLFTAYPDSCNLLTSDGTVIPGFFKNSALDIARQQISRFSEDELEKQVWIIQASFTSMTLGTDNSSMLHLDTHPPRIDFSYDRLIKASRAVGDRLCKLAIYHQKDTVGWLGVAPAFEREWNLLPADVDLYSGTSGIALFLAYLGKVTGEERYTTLAKHALITARYQFEQRQKMGDFGCIGGFDGVGAYIYLLSHLGTLWHNPALYREAEEIVQQLPDAIAHDEFFDVMAGSAGCIGALLSLYAVAPSEVTLAAAMQCGDRLIDCAKLMPYGIGWSTPAEEKPLAGLAHGNAGIAFNLLSLSAASGEERFRQAALAAMEYERSLFVPEQRNWPDLRIAPTSETADGKLRYSYMVAWCHGASGIGLARLASLHAIDDAAIRTEIDNALRTTLEQGFSWNHSLCHGAMGNLDTILMASQLLANPRHEEQLHLITSVLLDNIEVQGWVTGLPQGVETPGLMIGLSGIGYMLLRLAAPERVPSVLLLAPPR